MFSINENESYFKPHNALTKTKVKMSKSEEEMINFPAYHTPVPIIGPTTKRNLRIPLRSSPGFNPGPPPTPSGRSGKIQPNAGQGSTAGKSTPNVFERVQAKLKETPVAPTPVQASPRAKKPPIPKQRTLRPNGSAYARNFATTTAKKKPATRIPSKKTEIVLPPRFRPGSNLQTSTTPTRTSIPEKKPEIWTRPSKSNSYHQTRSNSSYFYAVDEPDSSWPMVRMPSDMFPPEKARWVQLALEKLMFNGTITQKQMNTPKFQRKIGTLYDSSVDQQALRKGSYLGTSKTPQSSIRVEYSNSNNNSKSQNFSQKSSPRQMLSGSASASGIGRKKVPPRKSGPSTPIKSPRSTRSTPRGEPELSSELQGKLSDVLLHLLKKGMMADDSKITVESIDALIDKRNISTNTELGEDFDDWAWTAKGTPATKSPLKSATTVEDITAPWIQTDSETQGVGSEPFQDIKNCFIFEGKICPLEASKRPISSFAPLSESRRKIYPTTDGYFRKIIDVRGFEAEDITIKYSNSRVFIEAKQSPTKDKNYRMVREIVVLPRTLKITDLKVMRARNNGRLVFEEQLSFQDLGVTPLLGAGEKLVQK